MAIPRETIRKKSEIRSLFQKGKRLSQKPVVLVYLKNSSGITRFLFCTNKTARNSVERNRVKRVLRALAYETSTFPLGFDIAIIADFPFTIWDMKSRRELFLTLVQRIRV